MLYEYWLNLIKWLPGHIFKLYTYTHILTHEDRYTHIFIKGFKKVEMLTK